MLIVKQKQSARYIERLISKFKKNGASRKTSIDNATRLSKLEAVRADFDSVYNKILEAVEDNHPYLAQDLYEETQSLYTKIKNPLLAHQPPELGAQNRHHQLERLRGSINAKPTKASAHQDTEI